MLLMPKINRSSMRILYIALIIQVIITWIVPVPYDKVFALTGLLTVIPISFRISFFESVIGGIFDILFLLFLVIIGSGILLAYYTINNQPTINAIYGYTFALLVIAESYNMGKYLVGRYKVQKLSKSLIGIRTKRYPNVFNELIHLPEYKEYISKLILATNKLRQTKNDIIIPLGQLFLLSSSNRLSENFHDEIPLPKSFLNWADAVLKSNPETLNQQMLLNNNQS